MLTEKEIQVFFKKCDRFLLKKRLPVRPYILPALFRFIYCRGIRFGEARKLKCDAIHLEKGYLDILNTKAHRDRRLFLSKELIIYLSNYDLIITKIFPERVYFFQVLNTKCAQVNISIILLKIYEKGKI